MAKAAITDLAAYRAKLDAPAKEAVRWHEAGESILHSNLKIAFAWQRMLLRYALGL